MCHDNFQFSIPWIQRRPMSLSHVFRTASERAKVVISILEIVPNCRRPSWRWCPGRRAQPCSLSEPCGRTGGIGHRPLATAGIGMAMVLEWVRSSWVVPCCRHASCHSLWGRRSRSCPRQPVEWQCTGMVGRKRPIVLNAIPASVHIVST